MTFSNTAAEFAIPPLLKPAHPKSHIQNPTSHPLSPAIIDATTIIASMPPTTPTSKLDIAIIGAGVIGLACALELAQRGRRVVVVDRATAGRGASFGNAGWLTPSPAFPLAQPGYAFKALKWMLDPESPFYIRPSLDPALLKWVSIFAFSSRRCRTFHSRLVVFAIFVLFVEHLQVDILAIHAGGELR